MRVVRVFATLVSFVLCALLGSFVGIALNSQAALLAGGAAGLVLGAVVALLVWRMPGRRGASRPPPAGRTAHRRTRKRRR